MTTPKTFELKPEHLTLLRRAWVDWEYGETGAPCIDPKRPYGNSDVAGDVIEALGWPRMKDRFGEDNWSEEVEQAAMELHRETQTALQVILSTQSFEPGIYECADPYNRTKWRRV